MPARFLGTQLIEDPNPSQVISEPQEINAEGPPPAPPIEPGADTGDLPPVEPTAPPPPQPDLEFRYRGERRPVPAAVVDPFAQSIGAPDARTAVQWAQQGRDLNYHRTRLDQEEQMIRDRERAIEEQRRQLEEYATEIESRYTPHAPGAPGYGAPNPFAGPQPGSYGYPPPAHPGGMAPANPYGYPQPGGLAPYAPPAFQGPIPQDPQARESMVLQALLSLPQHQQQAAAQQTAALNAVLNEFRRENQQRQRAELAVKAREQEAQLNTRAQEYVDGLTKEGWELPYGYNGERLLREANWLGLSANPHLPWPYVFETVAARHLYNQAPSQGQARMTADLETNRGQTFRVPPAKPSGVLAAPAGAAPVGNSLQERIRAARSIGDRVTMREALA